MLKLSLIDYVIYIPATTAVASSTHTGCGMAVLYKYQCHVKMGPGSHYYWENRDLACIPPYIHTHTGFFSWCKATSTGLPPRYEHAAFAVGDDVYVFAGAQENGPMNDLWKYDQG